jgi:hypothetical protein
MAASAAVVTVIRPRIVSRLFLVDDMVALLIYELTLMDLNIARVHDLNGKRIGTNYNSNKCKRLASFICISFTLNALALMVEMDSAEDNR